MKNARLLLASMAFILAVGAAFAARHNAPLAIDAYVQNNGNPSSCTKVGTCSNSGIFDCVINGQQTYKLSDAGTQCVIPLRRDSQ